jgi:hypothetical protein
MEPVPKILDWVSARAECSVDQLFTLLMTVVEADVKTMTTRTAPSTTIFSFHRVTETTVVVSKVWREGPLRHEDGVRFEKTAAGIKVDGQRNEQLSFVAKPSLHVSGVCRLEVADQPLELWQVSRRALEPLFFG